MLWHRRGADVLLRRTAALALFAVAAAARATSAADVPVSYLVEEKPLRGAQAGDSLLFELHTNASCTALAHTEVVPIESVELLSRLKLLTPKGGAKRPKTVELRHVLTGVTPAAQLYARVVGAAIVPAGAECQAQASGVPGPPGPHGEGTVLKDANGAVVGPFVFDGASTSGHVYLATPDGPLVAFANTASVGGSDMYDFVFPTTDCGGPRYSHAEPTNLGREVRAKVGNELYYYPRAGSPMTVNSYEFGPRTAPQCNAPYAFVAPDRCCCPSPGCLTPYNFDTAPPASISMGAFVPPFHVELQ